VVRLAGLGIYLKVASQIKCFVVLLARSVTFVMQSMPVGYEKMNVIAVHGKSEIALQNSVSSFPVNGPLMPQFTTVSFFSEAIALNRSFLLVHFPLALLGHVRSAYVEGDHSECLTGENGLRLGKGGKHIVASKLIPGSPKIFPSHTSLKILVLFE